MGEISGEFYPWSDNNTKRISEKSGVYGFYDAKKNLIYIGSAENLRTRFRHYWTTNFAEDPCKRDTKTYKQEFTSNYKAKEKELLEQYERAHGKLPKCNQKVT